jgi:hypothetical protein
MACGRLSTIDEATTLRPLPVHGNIPVYLYSWREARFQTQKAFIAVAY